MSDRCRVRGCLSVAAGALALALPASTSAATEIGATFDPGTSSCGNFLLQSVSPAADSYAVPAAGVITSWSYQASAEAGQLKLKVADPEGGNVFTVVGESAVETAVANRLNTFPTRIPVGALDVIGLTPVTVGLPCIRGMATGYSYSAYVMSPDVPPGQTASFNPPVANVQADIAAVVEPDADGDGFGDETQDECPGVSGSDVGCVPSPSPQPDSDPPETEITKGAPNKLDKSKVKFKFTADEPNVTFECKLDKKPYKPCSSPKKVKRLDDGKHKFKVIATDEAGNSDPSAAKDKFKVVD
jgi:hypothetical protein